MKKPNIKTSLGFKLKLFIVAFFVISAIFPIQSSYATQYQGTGRAIVQIGTVSSNCPQGWSATGTITQGPEGRTSHGDTPPPVQFGNGWLEAIDIGTPIGTPVYATVSGTVKIDNSRGSLDQRIAVTPNCPGLSVVYYWHLSEVDVADNSTVRFAQQIGLSGLEGTGAHTHYQFNPEYDRSYSISDPPHVPVAVPRYCDPTPCGITITSAP